MNMHLDCLANHIRNSTFLRRIRLLPRSQSLLCLCLVISNTHRSKSWCLVLCLEYRPIFYLLQGLIPILAVEMPIWFLSMI
jgi:hypothetical protein